MPGQVIVPTRSPANTQLNTRVHFLWLLLI